ncbi:MAG TPA: DUF885 domain-containing protein [Phenylobacterium sp.]|jgi:uncharacterized protein (DUF885 family)|uniref:DUF885 domain-containing protein n=1 Tax=Phenylobacterium sp. TaxID=1871053 RepID=UPI002CB4EC9A|nr:DUF885 domain-containing protein [Phenylobacterium sp.]HXA41096.1 DUF885 domain-containing protein [Phenylobacterium sp.]
MGGRTIGSGLVALVLALGTAPAVGLLAAPGLAIAQPSQAEAGKLTAFLDAEYEEVLKANPQQATSLGRKEGQDRLNDLSEAAELKRLEWRRGSVARMKAQFQRDKLPLEAKISFDMWLDELDSAELAYKFRRYDYALGGGALHSGLPNFLISSHLVDSALDMAAYNARVRALGPAMDQVRERVAAAAGEGVRMPRFQYERVIAESRKLISGQPFDQAGPDSPLWADAKAKVGRLAAAGKVTPAQAQALLDETRAALTGSMKPGYERLIAWVQADEPNAPSGKVGAVTLPGGLAWYAAALKLQTRTDLTADQVHALGLSEVKRIQGEMNALARTAGFKDAEAYYAELARLDPPQPYTDANRAEILAYSNALIANDRAHLPAMFNSLPIYGIEVVREPSFSEVPGGAAHTNGASPDGKRPGMVYLHMLGKTSPRASLPDLMCHEGIPGHAMQGDIRVRQKGVPKFRLGARNAAFNEGWGLYSELLCKEMGVYPDTASDFMRLDGELFRAARLVTDTGLHAKGWTEDEAVAYLKTTGHRSEDTARAETHRYIVNPGQATAYKIGMIRILALRTEAQKALGPKFDIKGFNDMIIASGSLPLSVLDMRVHEWVAERKAGA